MAQFIKFWAITTITLVQIHLIPPSPERLHPTQFTQTQPKTAHWTAAPDNIHEQAHTHSAQSTQIGAPSPQNKTHRGQA